MHLCLSFCGSKTRFELLSVVPFCASEELRQMRQSGEQYNVGAVTWQENISPAAESYTLCPEAT